MNKRYISLLLVVISVLFIGTGCDLLIKTNKGQADLNWYMGLTYQNENAKDIAYETGVEGAVLAAVALENEYSDVPGLVIGDDSYINIETVKDYIDDRFHWDSNEGLIMFTSATDIYESEVDSDVLNGENLGYRISIVDGQYCYVNTKFVGRFVDYKYQVLEGSEKVPTIISVEYSSGDKDKAIISSNIEMRTNGNYQNLIVTKLNKNEEVRVIEKGDNWTKVKNTTGYIGYVPTKKIKDETTISVEFANDYANYTHITLDGKVNLVWNQVYNQTANGNLAGLIKKVEGVNVISPTWFSVVDKKGNISSLADLDYVEKAHNNGMQVWPIINDFTDTEVTAKVLAKTSTRRNLVNNIMYFINSYDLDGINVDFEYVSLENSPHYLQFLRELSIEMRKAQKIFSIDNYAPSEWTMYYDRKQQGLLADYVIVMNYDEHTAGSDVPGSVASMPFARKGIEDTIAEVGDASRVISGIPFYTRIWSEVPEDVSDGSGVFIEDAANGNYYLTSQAVGMDGAKDAYKAAGATPEFDSETGQNYVSYVTKGDVLNKIWLEDETSIRSRLDLMNEYELGGVAFWALGQESDSIWKVISEYFK